ncbi:MAG: thiamine pyrophosphate-dependent dehydrogenase E1 component subunit alpha [Kurthia sp.]|nr:thiamine pyrophosphate-dependent dehydrogenase E1 component subunit alpha [Candidatus Kurthia equi]
MTLSHKEHGFTDEQALAIYYKMLRARRVDERLWLLNRSGKIPFVISCQGQEAAQIGAALALDFTKDYLAPYYRDLALVLEAGMTVKEIMLNAFAKGEDPNSGGRQMQAHWGHKKLRILSGSSPVTTQVIHAAGVALAGRMKKQDFYTFVTLGEGSSNQGDFHEGLNFVGVHQLPVITMVENNQYAISTPYDRQVASETVAQRATSYRMPGDVVDGTDPIAVYAAVKKARDSGKPALIEVLCHRLTPHSSDDDHRIYRTEEELVEDREKDGLLQFEHYLQQQNILTDEIKEEMNDKIKIEINEATNYAEQAPYGSLEDNLRYVYAEGENV